MEQPAARRRPILKAALGGAAAIGAVGGAVRAWPGSDPDAGSGAPTLSLVGDESDGIGELEVPLDGPVHARRSGDGRWETAGLSSTPYSMLALTWDATEPAPQLEVRTRADGRERVAAGAVLADGPDAFSDEDTSVAGTDLMWIGPSDGVQVRAGGGRPAGLSLVLLHPGAARRRGRGGPGRTGRAYGGRPRFAGRSRAASPPARAPEVGRPESWRRGHPHYNHTIKQVHVHHTASGNHYRRGDVPALIRGMYRYHTRYLGWSDIGYNFLVDRFGRIWTGRAGGSGRPVRGAHTLGFNSTSAGVAVIGNFETARPSDDVLDAVAAVAAWKLQPYDRDVMGNVRVFSHGSDRFRAGRKVRLPTIDGHRDTNETACPGRHLYRHLPGIRRRTDALIRRYSKVRIESPPSLHGTPALGSTLTVDPGTYSPADADLSFVWLRDGRPIPRASGREYVVGRPTSAPACRSASPPGVPA